MTHEGDVDRLGQELHGQCTQRHPSGRLSRTGPLENRTRLVEAVLLHAGQVGMSGAGPSQGRIAGQPGELVGVDGIG
jgi:hypothetical protein